MLWTSELFPGFFEARIARSTHRAYWTASGRCGFIICVLLKNLNDIIACNNKVEPLANL